MRRPWRVAAVAAVTAVAAVHLAAAPAHASAPPVARPGDRADPVVNAGARQAQFAAAAARYRVPESVLLAVSYLYSRWDTHDGLPSIAGGYGPMHLASPKPLPKRRTTHRPPPDTLREAARLTGFSKRRLRSDPAANILGGAALLAERQRDLGAPLSADPADWYGAVAAFAGDPGTAFADEVYRTIRTGAARTTDDGQLVRLPPAPGVRPRRPAAPRGSAFRGSAARTSAPQGSAAKGRAECPRRLSCAWLPAPYKRLGKGRYGNHDRWPGKRRIDYIVVHDGEASFDSMTRTVRNPRNVSWHYTLRSSDGHIAQHVRTRHIAWHSGNWYVNSRSIGLEHEGYLAKGGAWYTEAMYRSSARLVRHLARKHDIPLDRAHILGHDNVPGITPSHVAGMHEDPGPYWDWEHYFELLKAPLAASGTSRDRTAALNASAGTGEGTEGDAPAGADAVMILPDYDSHRPVFTGCRPRRPAAKCPARGASSVWLHTAPRPDAPLVHDPGKHPGGRSTRRVGDHAARASAGQVYAVAGRRGEWTAIWYLGRRAWFHNPPSSPTAVPVRAATVTPRGDRAVRVYGRAFPERSAYPPGVPVQRLVPLQYRLRPGQRYTVGLTVRSAYLRAASFDTSRHVLVTGDLVYHQIQLGHRIAYVKADDVRLSP